MNRSSGPRIELVAALEVITAWRTDEIVIATMGSSREWRRLSNDPRDFHYIPSTMSGGVPLGVGLAIAQPDKHVVVLSGDGSLLMSLGSLLTTTAAQCENLTIIVIDNGVYEVTGGQQLVAGSTAVDWPALAAAAGFPVVARFDDLTKWQSAAGPTLERPGPRFIDLVVRPESGDVSAVVPGPMRDRLAAFRAALGV